MASLGQVLVKNLQHLSNVSFWEVPLEIAGYFKLMWLMRGLLMETSRKKSRGVGTAENEVRARQGALVDKWGQGQNQKEESRGMLVIVSA